MSNHENGFVSFWWLYRVWLWFRKGSTIKLWGIFLKEHLWRARWDGMLLLLIIWIFIAFWEGSHTIKSRWQASGHVAHSFFSTINSPANVPLLGSYFNVWALLYFSCTPPCFCTGGFLCLFLPFIRILPFDHLFPTALLFPDYSFLNFPLCDQTSQRCWAIWTLKKSITFPKISLISIAHVNEHV